MPINDLEYILFSLKLHSLCFEENNIADFKTGRIHSFNNFTRFNDKANDINDNLKKNQLPVKKASQTAENTLVKEFTTIEEIKNHLTHNCNLLISKTAKNIVISDGNEKSSIMLIGEAPGEQEDIQAIPFCGKSGQLLRKALSKINLTTENVYITNTVFWRPPNNRQPTAEEIEYCRPYLENIISIIKPKLIITAGAVATKTLTNNAGNISSAIGKFQDLQINNLNIKLFPIYHPSYLLRNPISKKILWANLVYLTNNFNYDSNP